MSISKQTLSTLKPELVVWTDATSNDVWESSDRAIADACCHEIHTLGFVLYEDSKKLFMVMQIDLENGAISMSMCIPKGWIISRKKLKF